MPWNWFDLAFPWIGGVAAIVLLGLLFGTNLLRAESTSSRWRDPVWLSWMGSAAYLLHNVEEYGIDLQGQVHAFPAALCTGLGLRAYPDCPVPAAFFTAVNISLIWVVAPLAAMLSRRRPLVGLSLYGIIFVNGLVHVLPALLLGKGYNAGLLSAAGIFLPLSAWVAYACFGSGRLSYRALGILLFSGILVHVVLLGSMMLFLHGVISGAVLIGVQIANAALVLAVPWIAETRWEGALARPGLQ